jgi:hypothetical protein
MFARLHRSLPYVNGPVALASIIQAKLLGQALCEIHSAEPNSYTSLHIFCARLVKPTGHNLSQFSIPHFLACTYSLSSLIRIRFGCYSRTRYEYIRAGQCKPFVPRLPSIPSQSKLFPARFSITSILRPTFFIGALITRQIVHNLKTSFFNVSAYSLRTTRCFEMLMSIFQNEVRSLRRFARCFYR